MTAAARQPANVAGHLLMDLPFELFVALRYLLARRKQAFISLISLISVLGVTVGVMALLIALALMTGLQGELRDRIVGSAAHVYVMKAAASATRRRKSRSCWRCRACSAPRRSCMGKALLTSDAGGEAFITVKGVVPAQRTTVTQIEQAMLSGALDALEHRAGEIAGHSHRQGSRREAQASRSAISSG